MEDYYKTCPYPKPTDNKKKKKANGYKDKPFRYCFYCGTPFAERHEVFPGRNRQISIDNGFQVDLCHSCHEEIQQRSTERGRQRDMALRKMFQKRYEEKLIGSGISEEQAREVWMNLVGRNYR